MLVLNAVALSFSCWQNGPIHPLNLIILINFAFIVLTRHQLMRLLGEVIIPSSKTRQFSDIGVVIKDYIIQTKSLAGDFQTALSNINEIGHDGFSEMVQTLTNKDIRTSLLSANEEIIQLRKKEKDNNWITEGVAAIAAVQHKGNDIANYSSQIISAIVKYVNANQGGFYILHGKGVDAYFDLTASYAFGKKRAEKGRINIGEGLLGQAFYDKNIVCLNEVPKNYVKITSGLGEASPRYICIVPLLSEGSVFGVIEVASFNQLQKREIEYLEKIAESVGYNLNSIDNNRRTELLLEESQKMEKEVKSQEEELRQNMEELSAAQEQMKRKQVEIDTVLSSLSTIELDLDGMVIQANPVFLGITGYNLADIKGKSYKSLIPQNGNDSSQYDMMWSSILTGHSFSGEFRIVNKSQKEMWIAGNFSPILGDEGKPYKIMVISLFTTQDKEKLLELQEMVLAIKECFPIAEINPDLTFKTANDLFLTELGIKRIELKKVLPKDVLRNGSYYELKRYLVNNLDLPDNIEMEIQNRNGMVKRFNSTLMKINNNGNQQKKGLLILRNPILP